MISMFMIMSTFTACNHSGLELGSDQDQKAGMSSCYIRCHIIDAPHGEGRGVVEDQEGSKGGGGGKRREGEGRGEGGEEGRRGGWKRGRGGKGRGGGGRESRRCRRGGAEGCSFSIRTSVA